MKKIVSILLLAATLMFALSACGMGKPKIEDYRRFVNHYPNRNMDNTRLNNRI